ncbi:Shedu anti-phage system protein SduA domain-containing protein [Moraxella sp. ZY210820]|uniref:Shedu anti-phage system protein SduA domain-containing protein n=1 Tax=unclassified Moraxella TaxID=2685852 RepID=UPI002730C857|nr:Shedu anti-phage system protein SduA domain-containing protein [Moraxella sp. ZY210820]WLF83472.1 DUF4263 domain-containing protein [Moraxella sp. ZY210820]
MKILDFVLDFTSDKLKGFCRVRTYMSNQQPVTILTELDKNDGQSVTNAVEIIIEKLHNEFGFKKHIFIEHYEKLGDTNNSFDLTTINLNKKPQWQTLNNHQMIEIIGEENFNNLINDRSSYNSAIIHQADTIRFKRNIWADFPWFESSRFIQRKLAIEKQMKSKQELINLIQSNAKERELLSFFKEDLSFFGEIYAELEDEYIVFSEYPIHKGTKDKDGFVDFVIFTGRSRMMVILIEIKGSDFNLFNQTGYKQPHSHISIAAQQIRNRLDSIYGRYYDEFRKECHKIRKLAEKNKSPIKHTLLGAKPKLQVDENKDINIRTVIIGGRTVNDYEESMERSKFERSHTISVILDSWDTWVRKLKRDN